MLFPFYLQRTNIQKNGEVFKENGVQKLRYRVT